MRSRRVRGDRSRRIRSLKRPRRPRGGEDNDRYGACPRVRGGTRRYPSAASFHVRRDDIAPPEYHPERTPGLLRSCGEQLCRCSTDGPAIAARRSFVSGAWPDLAPAPCSDQMQALQMADQDCSSGHCLTSHARSPVGTRSRTCSPSSPITSPKCSMSPGRACRCSTSRTSCGS